MRPTMAASTIAQPQDRPRRRRILRAGFGAGLAVAGGRRRRACFRLCRTSGGLAGNRRLDRLAPASPAPPPRRAVMRAGFRRLLIRRGRTGIGPACGQGSHASGRCFGSVGKRRRIARLARFARAAGGGFGRVPRPSLDCRALPAQRRRQISLPRQPYRPPEIKGSAGRSRRQAAVCGIARLAALATAFKEAVTMSLSMPTP